MSDFSDSLIESGCTLLLNHCSGVFTVRDDSHSGISILLCNKKKFLMIHSVDSPQQIFVADCGQRESMYLPTADTAHQTGSGGQPDSIRLSQKSDIR